MSNQALTKRSTWVIIGVVVLALIALLWLQKSNQNSTAHPVKGATSGVVQQNSATASPTKTGTATAHAAQPVAGATDPISGLAWVEPVQLPKQALQTLALIDQGGPFPYSRDGVVFSNFEGVLPKKASDYYHEYTVPTPGASTRGTRRIITGKSGEFYYTDDHYETFKRIRR